MLTGITGPGRRARALSLAAYTVGLLALNAAVVRAWIHLARSDETASHLILVPVAALGLIFQRRRTVFASPAFDAPACVVPILAGIALAWTSRRSGAELQGSGLTVAVAAVVLLWIAGFLLLYGRRAAVDALFPLSFLVFTIPIPGPLLTAATLLLKKGSAEAVAMLLTISGTPYHQEGYVFSLPHFVIEIADECSGIRSSIALVLTTLLLGEVFLDSAWKKAALVIISLPLAVLKNAIRIVSLTLLAIHVDPSFLSGALHHEGGIAFFLIALMLLAPVVRLLQRAEKLKSPQQLECI